MLAGAMLAGLLMGVSSAWLRREPASSVLFTIPIAPVSTVYYAAACCRALSVAARTGVAAVATSAGVTLLDTRHGVVLRTVAISQGDTAAVAFDERARHVIAASSTGISVLDAQGGGLLHTLRVALSPLALMVDERAGHTFILNGDGKVVMIDTRSGKILHTSTVGTPGSLSGGAVDAQTGRAFVASSVDDSVSVLDTRTGRLLATVLVARSPQAVAVDASLGRVFIASSGVASGGSGRSVLDAHRGAVLRIQSLTTTPVALAVDTRVGHVFLVNGARDANATGISSISMLDARSGTILHRVPISPNDSLATIAVDPRRDRVFVMSQGPQDSAQPGVLTGIFTGAGRLYVLDARTGVLLRTLPTGVAPLAVGIDEDTGRVVVLNAGGTVDTPDTWGWLPPWLRRWLSFLPPLGTHVRTVPGSVTVLDVTR